MSGDGKTERQTAEQSRAKLITDIGPLAVFFIAYKVKDIYWATGSLMITTPLALAYAWVKERKLPAMPIVTAVIVLVFGGMTIALGDPRFIYIKPTLVAGLSALVLIGGVALGKPLLKPLLGAQLALRDEGWKALSLRFGLFSAGLAGANEIVWRAVTPERENLWVWFKLLGIPVLTIAFLATQAGLIRRFGIEDRDPPPEADPAKKADG